MKILNTLMALALAGLLVLGLVVAAGFWIYKTPSVHQNEAYVVIASGSSVYSIAKQLKKEGLLSHKAALVFPYIARLKGVETHLKAGEYMIPPHASAQKIMWLLKAGKTIQRQITFAEGLTSFEIVERLNNCDQPKTTPEIKEDGADENNTIETTDEMVIASVETVEIIESISPELCVMTGRVADIPAEGSLLPESYAYSRDEDRNDVIMRMRVAMKKTMDELWETRADDLPLKSKAEAQILASIVEKETGIATERARVAGVFINRLRKGMMLQTDPTVIYAITKGVKKLDRPLYFKDLKRDDPYNTYMVTGLPPTPIANAGRASIEATLNPEEHDYLYFVADGTGGHVFSKTLDEHNKNVAKWRKINKK